MGNSMNQDAKISDIPGLEQLIHSSAKKISIREFQRSEHAAKLKRAIEHDLLLSRFDADPGSDPLLTLEGPMTIDQVRERFALLQGKADAGDLK